MQFNSDRRLQRNPLAAAVVLSLLLPTTMVQARDAADTEAATPAAETRTLDRVQVTVTGSRIARAGFDTLEPAQVVTRETIDELGITNVAEALFRQPSFNAAASVRGNQAGYGAGVSFVSRFGLGSQRELTLVNGRRMVSSNPSTNFGPSAPGQQVDLNVVPTALIERVETIGIGGAPTYGSDAISGVTNVILRKDFEGVETSLGIGATGYGDNARLNVSSTFGRNFADGRGNVTITAAHDRSSGVLGAQRAWYRQGWQFLTNPSASAVAQYMPGRTPTDDGRYNTTVGFDGGPADGVPGSVLVRDGRLGFMTWGGMLFPTTGGMVRDAAGQLNGFGAAGDTHYQFNEAGRLVPFNPGAPFGTGGWAAGGDGLALARDTTQVTSELERNNLFGTFGFDLRDNLRVFGELSAYQSQAYELVDQSIYNVIGSGGVNGPLTFSIDNPFLHADDREQLQALGIDSFRLSRSSRDLLDSRSSASSRVNRVVAGLEGWFDLGQRAVDWEVSVNHGRGEFRYDRAHLHQQNFLNAIAVRRDATGSIVCDSTVAGTVADPACVPLNLFGEGNMSPEALAYVTRQVRSRAGNRQTVFNANATVGLFDLPGGEVKTNLGYEHRRESADFNPSAFEQEGLGRSVPIAAIAGKYTTNEVFAEVLAPVFGPYGNVPGVHRLDLTVKARHVDNSLAGTFNAWTWGVQYEPVAGVQLRGNKTRSFRAPSIVELFQPVTSYYAGIPELCTTANIGGGVSPDVRRANCASFFAAYPGVDPATFAGLAGTQLSTTGGNINLKNEQADSWTAGIVLQPTFAPGLTVAADYYDIRLTDAITSLSASAVASACFDNPEFDAGDVANANAYCSLITRNAQGQASSVSTTRVNGQVQHFKGWTGEVRYQFPLAGGRVNLGLQAYLPNSLTIQTTPVVAPLQYVGDFGYAKRQLQWNASWAGEALSFGLSANYNSRTVLDTSAGNLPEQRDFWWRDSFTMWDGFVGYRVNDQVRVNLAVQNLRNQIGPFPYVDDALGRRFMLTARFSH